ncbi:MAG: phytanoyl-CoA dioxygenase family protein [Steroidobacteraceae bacterium]
MKRMQVMELPRPEAVTPVEHLGVRSDPLSEAQLESFRRDGYVVVQNLTEPGEIENLRVAYDRLFSERRGWESGDLFDLVGDDSKKGELALPQLLWPSRYEPALRKTKLATSANMIARQLLGPDVQNILEHAIMKPAQTGAATPWHQDDAFNRPGSGFVEQISIWMALQDVTLDSGCLKYIRGSNHGPLFPHRSPGDDPRIHGLETAEIPDLKNCVSVPVPCGGAVIHHSRTLHSAGVNTSSIPRRAYVLGYSVQSRNHRLLLTRDYPWNLEKKTAREQREFRSLPPFKRAVRRIRRLLRGQKF